MKAANLIKIYLYNPAGELFKTLVKQTPSTLGESSQKATARRLRGLAPKLLIQHSKIVLNNSGRYLQIM